MTETTASAAVRPDSDRFRTGNVVTISLAHLSHDVFSSFLAPLLPLFISKLGLSLSAVALLDVVRKIPHLFNPLLGLLADRVCVKYVVILAPAVTATTMSLLGLAPSFPILASLLLISGFSAAAFHVLGPVLVKRYSGANTGRGMSFYMFGGELARTLGPLLITAAVSWWGLEGSYRVLPLGLAASVLMYFKLRHLQPQPNRRPARSIFAAGSDWRAHAPLFAGLTGYLVFRMGLKLALTLYLPTYLAAQGKTLWVAGGALSLLQLSGAIGTFGAGYVADRFGHRRSLLMIAALTPVAGVSLALSSGLLAIPLLIVSGFLIFAAGRKDDEAAEYGGRKIGSGHGCGAKGLKQGTGGHHVAFHTPICFGNNDAEPAHLRRFIPNGFRTAGLRVQQLLDNQFRGFPPQKVHSRIHQHLVEI